MVRRCFFTLVFSLLGVGLSFSAQALDIKVAKGLCHGVAKDDTKMIKKTLRKNRVKLRKVYSEVMCNGSSLLMFALKRNANDAGTLLVEQLPDEMLNNGGPDGYMVLTWGEHNGYADSPIIKAIRKRI